jgi:U2 small nuclear ribonucleoprotein B''
MEDPTMQVDHEDDEEESDEEDNGPPPNHTIRVNNLNEKVKGPKLKSALRAVFKQFGDILEIVAMDSLKRRGQAFVVFDQLEAAEDAKTRMQGFPFYDKPMRIEFARNNSDVITRREGDVPESAAQRKVKRERVWAEEKKNPPPPKKVKPQAEIPAMSAVPAPTQRPIEAPPPPEMQMPNNILFIQNLPDESAEGALNDLFRACQGFVELRAIPGRSDIAFVEFDDDMQAGMAMQMYQGYKLGASSGMVISYAKK